MSDPKNIPLSEAGIQLKLLHEKQQAAGPTEEIE